MLDFWRALIDHFYLLVSSSLWAILMTVFLGGGGLLHWAQIKPSSHIDFVKDIVHIYKL